MAKSTFDSRMPQIEGGSGSGSVVVVQICVVLASEWLYQLGAVKETWKNDDLPTFHIYEDMAIYIFQRSGL
jgi:hypothetical protein